MASLFSYMDAFGMDMMWMDIFHTPTATFGKGIDHALYTKSSLVQIAWRVGRSKERPDGLVLFFVQEQTRASKQAIQEIKQMNQEAGF